MTNYYRVHLGKQASYASQARAEGFIGVDFDIDMDLSDSLHDNWRDFNKEFIPYLQNKHPEQSKISAGLACGNLWVVVKGMQIGDTVISPDGLGNYMVGTIISDYIYLPSEALFHRRNVKWTGSFSRENTPTALRKVFSVPQTAINVTDYANEIELLIANASNDLGAELFIKFSEEKQLEDFLVKHWKSTELGAEYDIFEEEGEARGQQFVIETSRLDILAISKDKSKILVVELKQGKAGPKVLEQIQRYRALIMESHIPEAGQEVLGVVIAEECDENLRKAISITDGVEFKAYKLKFELE